MQNHYNYVFDDITNTYNFTTRNNILYRVAFIVDETFSAISGEEIPNIFQLVIEKAVDEVEPYDSKVSSGGHGENKKAVASFIAMRAVQLFCCFARG